MDRKYLLVLCLASGFALAQQANIGQTNSAQNGFSNAAISGQTNTQVNMNSDASAKYGNGVECPEGTINVSPYGSTTQMGGAQGQTVGVAVGISIPLGDGGTCRKMAHNLEQNQRTTQNYERIKLCIELKKNHVIIDREADPDLYATCQHVHMG